MRAAQASADAIGTCESEVYGVQRQLLISQRRRTNAKTVPRREAIRLGLFLGRTHVVEPPVVHSRRDQALGARLQRGADTHELTPLTSATKRGAGVDQRIVPHACALVTSPGAALAVARTTRSLPVAAHACAAASDEATNVRSARASRLMLRRERVRAVG